MTSADILALNKIPHTKQGQKKIVNEYYMRQKLLKGGSNTETVEFYATPSLAYAFGILQRTPEELRIGI
jgi:hypothetical protein